MLCKDITGSDIVHEDAVGHLDIELDGIVRLIAVAQKVQWNNRVHTLLKGKLLAVIAACGHRGGIPVHG